MSLLERARTLGRELPRYRASHTSEKRLDPAIIGRLRDEGFLTCLLPRELGGSELAPGTYVEVLATLGRGDAATAWCVMTASTSTLVAVYLPKTSSAALFARETPFLAGVFAPSGKITDGRLSGRWSYMSGSRHADWFAVGAISEKRHVVCFVERQKARIVDNWDTLGLAGTGSHDLLIEDALLDPAHITPVMDGKPWSDAPLYKVPLFGLLAAGIAACGLGIAEAALQHVASQFAAEVPSSSLARYAELRAKREAARAYLLATCEKALREAETGAVQPETRGQLRVAAVHVSEQCAEVVRSAFHLGGGSSIRADSPLGWALCDIETLLTHRMVSSRVIPAAARAMLGLGTPPPDL